MTRTPRSKQGRRRRSCSEKADDLSRGRCASASEAAPSQPDAATLLRFLNAVRRGIHRIPAELRSPLEFCEALIGFRPPTWSAIKHGAMLASAASDLRDYQIASAYALLIGKSGARSFRPISPPSLTAATLRAAAPFLRGKASASILDPACGGGAFLVPLARSPTRAQLRNGAPAELACRRAVEQLHGVEIDEGLATLSRRLLAAMLKNEFSVASAEKRTGASGTRFPDGEV